MNEKHTKTREKKPQMKYEWAFILTFFVGMLAGASVGWGSWNECQDQVEQLEWERDWAYDAYDKYRTLYDYEWEAHKDAGFERMVREQVTKVITDYECGKDPFPPQLCEAERARVLEQKLLQTVQSRESSFRSRN